MLAKIKVQMYHAFLFTFSLQRSMDISVCIYNKNKLGIFKASNLDKIGQFGQNWIIGLHWATQTKLDDNLNKIGRFGWQLWQKLNNSDDIGIGQNLANDWFRKKRSIEVWCISHSNSFLSILIHWHHHGGCFSRLFNVAIHRSNEFAHVVTKSQEQ